MVLYTKLEIGKGALIYLSKVEDKASDVKKSATRKCRNASVVSLKRK
jgi:hypothetical protein